MHTYSGLSDNAKMKLRLYTAAFYLFEEGKSYPQIIELLKKYEPDEDVLRLIVDNAMREDWDKLYFKAKDLFTQGKTYAEVISEISKSEPDKEIAKWICDDWYKWKQLYAELVIESPTNIAEGSQWVIICLLVIPILFLADASLVVKIIWGVSCLFAILLWVMGIRQRKLSKKIHKILQGNE